MFLSLYKFVLGYFSNNSNNLLEFGFERVYYVRKLFIWKYGVFIEEWLI